MRSILFIFLYSWSTYLSAQSIAINKIELDKKIDSLYQSFNNKNSPGFAITVIQNEKVITKKDFGLANLEHSIPFTHKSPVRLVYSMTREFMSVGLAIMEYEGLLRFDDKVRKYLPKLPKWSKDVTIQDLLNHSSGFDDEWSLGLLMHDDMRNRLDKEQALTWLYNQPKPQIEPGKGYMYCNTDYALIRLVMEMASKQSLPDYLKDKLFDPLGMVSTFMNDDIEAVIPGFAESYYGYKPFRKARFYKTSPGGNYRIVTTADDLEKWLKSIEDSFSIVSRAFKRLYQDARPIPVVSPEQHYTFGHEWHKRDSVEFVYHGGVGESFYIFRIPSEGIAIISLGNGGNNIWAMMQLADGLLPPKPLSKFNAPVFPAEPIVLTNKELAKFEGRYFQQKNKGYNSHIENISFYDIKQEGDSLNLYYSKDASIPITAFGHGLFKDMDENVPMQFTNINPDAPMKLSIWTPNGQILNYQRKEPKEKINKVYLKQFLGQFYSPHLDYYFRIIVNEEGQLIIKRPTVSDKIMQTYGDNSFFFEGETGAYNFYTQATFTKNEKGEIDGFNLQDSRMMHHRFNKVK